MMRNRVILSLLAGALLIAGTAYGQTADTTQTRDKERLQLQDKTQDKTMTQTQDRDRLQLQDKTQDKTMTQTQDRERLQLQDKTQDKTMTRTQDRERTQEHKMDRSSMHSGSGAGAGGPRR